jgi:hypothetical protein
MLYARSIVRSALIKLLKSDIVLLLGLALLVRALAAWPQTQPGYMDAAYYYTTAVNLAEGRGFVQDYVWNYLGDPGLPPQPSHTYWMPLTSLLAAGGMVVGGVNYRAAQLFFVLLAALLAPISYHVAWLLFPVDRPARRRSAAWLAGLLAIFSGFYMPYWTAIDNFTPFAVAGSLALLATWYGIRRHRDTPGGWLPSVGYLLLAGISAGLGHLARADGLLLLVVIMLYAIIKMVTFWRQPAAQASRRWWLWLLLPPAGYLLVMAPWLLRNWQLLGTPLPVAGSQTIWLVSYDDLFSYGRELSPRTFLAQPVQQIIMGRWWALTVNLQTVVAVWGMIIIIPLALVGGWTLRRHGLVQLAAGYGVLLIAVMTLLFAFPGARGGLFHSGGALLPYIYATGVAGLDHTIRWIAARRRHWRPDSAWPVFATGLLLLAMALSGLLYYRQVIQHNAWNGADAIYPDIAQWVAAQDSQAVVMIGNPPAYRYHGGGLSVVVPNEPLPVTLAVAHQYGVEYLVLDRNHPASLTPVYENPTKVEGLKLARTFGTDVFVFELVLE